jgi:hypothetical protein
LLSIMWMIILIGLIIVSLTFITGN